MDSRAALERGLAQADMILQAYLADLNDADLLVRPVPGCNHIAWQFGHFIVAEHDMLSAVSPGCMPALPGGFRERHSKPAAASDVPGDFCTKQEYLEAYRAQRAGTLATLKQMSDADFDQPAPEALRSFLGTVGDVFAMQATHLTMHTGQWAVIRRTLGKPPLF